MKVSEIFKTVEACDRLRLIMLTSEHDKTTNEIQEICDLLFDYREELLKKETK